MKRSSKFLPWLIVTLFVILACNINTSLVSPRTAPDMQATNDASINATRTSDAQVQATIDAMVATSNAAATATFTLPPPTTVAPSLPPTTAATDTPLPSPTASGPVLLSRWELFHFVQLSSGCKFDHLSCWRADDDYKKHFGQHDLYMLSEDSAFVDPSWAAPHLIFWHKRNLKAPAEVNLLIDGNWIKVRDYTKSMGDWTLEQINLRDFKGKTIRVRFSLVGVWGSGRIPSSDWFIQGVQVVPDLSFVENP